MYPYPNNGIEESTISGALAKKKRCTNPPSPSLAPTPRSPRFSGLAGILFGHGFMIRAKRAKMCVPPPPPKKKKVPYTYQGIVLGINFDCYCRIFFTFIESESSNGALTLYSDYTDKRINNCISKSQTVGVNNTLSVKRNLSLLQGDAH